MTKVEVVRKIVRLGLGLPKAIKVYNELSHNGFYEVEKDELNKYIKENLI